MSTKNDNEDDDDDRHRIYGLPNTDRKFDKSFLWIPAVIGISVAAGILTTKGIQRLTRGVSIKNVSKPSSINTTTTNTTSNATVWYKKYESMLISGIFII